MAVAQSQHWWSEHIPVLDDVEALDLPPGRPFEAPTGGFGWLCDADKEHSAGWWLTWAQCFTETGLWPIGTFNPRWEEWGLGTQRWGEPWDHHPYRIPSDVLANAQEFRDENPDWFDGDDSDSIEDEAADYVTWPPHLELAAPSVLPDDLLSTLGPVPYSEQLVLVPCHRPADAPLALDFGIPNEGITPGIMTGVLRSWEQRFGLVPVEFAVEWTGFQVVAPPTDRAAIERLAEEVTIFAIDSVSQGGIHASDDTTQHLFYTDFTSPDVFVTKRNWGIWWD